MLSWLSNLRKQPRRRGDELFGVLTYMGGYWEGAGTFPPTQTQVEYFISAGELGPTDANREAFQAICNNYPAVLAGASAVILSTLGLKLGPDDLALSSMDIPATHLDLASWEISFAGRNGQLFSVVFEGLHAKGPVDVSG